MKRMRNFRPARTTAAHGGFGLIQLMVGVAVGMIGILVVMQVFANAEERRRSTGIGSDAQINGLTGAFMIDRDVRVAGFGTSLFGCDTIKTYDKNASPQTGTMSALPATITQSTPEGSGNDQIRVQYSTSAYGSIPATIQKAMPSSSAEMKANSGIGFKQGDQVVVTEPGKDCTRLQMSQDGHHAGGNWNLQHNSGNCCPYNPPGGHNIFPEGGYGVGAKVYNLGALVNRSYFVENRRLMTRDLTEPDGANNPLSLADGIIALRAVYGRDTNGDGKVDAWDNTAPATVAQLIAIRYAIVARSGQYEKEQVTPAATLALWSGGPEVALRDDSETELDNRDRHFRYKVYQTTVPLRNVIWGNVP